MQKIYFCSDFGKKEQKIGHSVFLSEYFVIWFSPHSKFHVWKNSRSNVIAQNALNLSNCRIPESPLSQKWVEVWTWFLNGSKKLIGLGLTWLFIHKLPQNYKPGICLKDRYARVSFVYWTPINRGSFEIIVVCPSSVGEFNISIEVVDCFFFLNFLMRFHYYFLTSQNWQPSFNRNFIFTCIGSKRAPKQGILYFF